MDETTKRVSCDHTEQPHNQKNYRDSPKHTGSFQILDIILRAPPMFVGGAFRPT
jgi:hypothetical protein